jgi:hypothetical protein
MLASPSHVIGLSSFPSVTTTTADAPAACAFEAFSRNEHVPLHTSTISPDTSVIDPHASLSPLATASGRDAPAVTPTSEPKCASTPRYRASLVEEFVVVIETPIVSCRVKHDDAVVVSPFTDAKNAITSIAIKVRAAVRFAIFLIHRLFPSGVDLAPTRVEDDDAR